MTAAKAFIRETTMGVSVIWKGRVQKLYTPHVKYRTMDMCRAEAATFAYGFNVAMACVSDAVNRIKIEAPDVVRMRRE